VNRIYEEDLAYIQAKEFGGLAEGAASEIIRRLRRAAVPVKRVVDAGCGAGPLSKALVEAGFDVTGIDASPALLEFAREAAPKARFVCGSIYDVELPACEAIVAVGEPLTYHDPGVDGLGRLRTFFERAAAVLPSGGLLIFDLIERGEVSLSNRGFRSGEDWAILYETQEQRDSLIRFIETFRCVGECYRRGYETHGVQVFNAIEVREELHRCFRVDMTGSYGAQELGPRRVAFFATRI
jgi:SAM-dependent methyltransferase